MTLERLVVAARMRYMRQRFEREGQAAFNVVDDMRPDIANVLRGTDCDPFYNDDLLPVFWQRVEELL